MSPALEHEVASTARTEPAPDGATHARARDAAEEPDEPLPFLFHALIMACVVAMVLLFRYAYDYYSLISQEDHIVEWSTVVLYVPAALLGLRYALRRRRLFDGLIALYCFFVGGEEFSWGQRLVGFKPPKLFLADNLQQEVSLHNFFGPSVHDLIFSAAVLGYGVVLPLLARRPRTRALLERAGATAPPVRFVPWCLFFVVLYVWYPMHLSSEWIEMIIAALFLAGAALLTRRRLTAKQIVVSLGLVFALGAGLTVISNAHERKGNPERAACARAESRALLADIVDGGAAKEKLLRAEEPLHRRIIVAIDHDYLYGDKLQQLNAVRCSPPADEGSDARRRYAVDPWGLSYWFFVEKLEDGRRQLTVYSFGPNRRRDSDEGAPGRMLSPDDDDIAATGILPPPDEQASPESHPPAPPK
jgi:hypothetical protein